MIFLFHFTYNLPTQCETWSCLFEHNADVLAEVLRKTRFLKAQSLSVFPVYMSICCHIVEGYFIVLPITIANTMKEGLLAVDTIFFQPN